MSCKLSLHCACNIDPLDNNMFYGSLIVMTFHAYITCCWVRRSLSCLRNKVSAKMCDRKCYHHITKCFAVDIYAHKEYPQLFILYKHTPIPTWTLCVLHTFSDLNICNCCYIYIHLYTSILAFKAKGLISINPHLLISFKNARRA